MTSTTAGNAGGGAVSQGNAAGADVSTQIETATTVGSAITGAGFEGVACTECAVTRSLIHPTGRLALFLPTGRPALALLIGRLALTLQAITLRLQPRVEDKLLVASGFSIHLNLYMFMVKT